MGTVESYNGRELESGKREMVVALVGDSLSPLNHTGTYRLSPAGWTQGKSGEGLVFSLKYINEYINDLYRTQKGMTLTLGAIPNDTYQKYSFVLDGYKPKRLHYWDTVEMFRKIVFVGLVSFYGLGSMRQLAWATVIEVVFAFACAYLQPFESADGTNWASNVTKIYFEATLVLTLCLTTMKKAIDLDTTNQLDVTDGFVDDVLFYQLALPCLATLYKCTLFCRERTLDVMGVIQRENRV